MNGILKKVVAAVAIKEGIEKIQEMRRPRRSFLSRLGRPLLLLSAIGGIAYLQQTGKLGPLVQQAKGLAGSPGSGSGSSVPSSNGAGAPLASSTTGGGSL